MTMVRRLSQPYISDGARRGQEKQTIDRHSIPANQNHDPIEQLKAAAPLWSTLGVGVDFQQEVSLIIKIYNILFKYDSPRSPQLIIRI